jgi:hypothetical protein
MAKANTRQIDRIIRDSESRLRRVRDGEITALSGGEQARLALHIGRGVAKVARGKSTSRADRAQDQVFADAEERIGAELQAAQQARAQIVSRHAADTVAKRAERRWL